MENKFSHLDNEGNVRMVNVSDKGETMRFAVAKGEVVMDSRAYHEIRSGNLAKGDLFTVAKLAGILGAKRTGELIPLCHTLPLQHIAIELKPDDDLPGIEITASVQTVSKTGVEMEALTAVTLTALTIYDMAKSVDKSMTIQNIRLIEKHGGKSGHYINE